MKKSIKIMMGLVMAAVIFISFAPTKAEATQATWFTGDNVRVETVKRHTKSKLTGTVVVTTQEATAPRKAKIVVGYKGTRYKDHCAKLISSERLPDGKGGLSNDYEHTYKFHGCRTTKY